MHETPCQAFEAVQVVNIPQKKKVVTMSSLKDAKAVVEAGHPEGWGRVLDLPPKFDKMGLGYSAHQFSRTVKDKRDVQFTSAGYILEDQVNVVKDNDEDADFSRWIKPSVPEQELQNWTAEAVGLVTFSEE